MSWFWGKDRVDSPWRHTVAKGGYGTLECGSPTSPEQAAFSFCSHCSQIPKVPTHAPCKLTLAFSLGAQDRRMRESGPQGQRPGFAELGGGSWPAVTLLGLAQHLQVPGSSYTPGLPALGFLPCPFLRAETELLPGLG